MASWSIADDASLLQMRLAESKSVPYIASKLGRSESAVYRRLKRLGKLAAKLNKAPLRPVVVRLPKAPAIKTKPVDYSVLVWGDVHFPFHDPGALGILRSVASDIRPRKLVCLGDVFDFFELSDHRPPGSADPNLQATVEMGVQHLADIRNISKASEAFFLAGNHEDRWDRMLIKASTDPRFGQIFMLPALRSALSFPEVVGFQKLGYTFYPLTESPVFIENGQLVYTHEDCGRSSVWPTRGSLFRYGKNVIFGHRHIIQNFTRRDLKGQEASWCTGCLCTLEPHYMRFADWHHGFVVVNWKRRVPDKWIFHVEQIRIHDGVAIWRDRIYNRGREYGVRYR